MSEFFQELKQVTNKLNILLVGTQLENGIVYIQTDTKDGDTEVLVTVKKNNRCHELLLLPSGKWEDLLLFLDKFFGMYMCEGVRENMVDNWIELCKDGFKPEISQLWIVLSVMYPEWKTS